MVQQLHLQVMSVYTLISKFQVMNTDVSMKHFMIDWILPDRRLTSVIPVFEWYQSVANPVQGDLMRSFRIPVVSDRF